MPAPDARPRLAASASLTGEQTPGVPQVATPVPNDLPSKPPSQRPVLRSPLSVRRPAGLLELCVLAMRRLGDLARRSCIAEVTLAARLDALNRAVFLAVRRVRLAGPRGGRGASALYGPLGPRDAVICER